MKLALQSDVSFIIEQFYYLFIKFIDEKSTCETRQSTKK